MSTRNFISEEASKLQLVAKRKADLAFLTPDEPMFNGLAGDCQQLANDCCESRHTIESLKKRHQSLVLGITPWL